MRAGQVRRLPLAGREAMRALVGRVGEPERLGARVHELDEGRGRARDVLGDRHRGIVGRRDHHRLQQLTEREGLALREVDLGAADAARPRRGAHRRVECERTVAHPLHGEEHRHHLRHRGGWPALVRVVLREDRTAVGVHDDVGHRRRRLAREERARRRPDQHRRGRRHLAHHLPPPLNRRPLPGAPLRSRAPRAPHAAE